MGNVMTYLYTPVLAPEAGARSTAGGAFLFTSPSVSQWNIEQACCERNTGPGCFTQPTLFPELVIIKRNTTMGLATEFSTLVTGVDVVSVQNVVSLLFLTCYTCVRECTLTVMSSSSSLEGFSCTTVVRQ